MVTRNIDVGKEKSGGGTVRKTKEQLELGKRRKDGERRARMMERQTATAPRPGCPSRVIRLYEYDEKGQLYSHGQPCDEPGPAWAPAALHLSVTPQHHHGCSLSTTTGLERHQEGRAFKLSNGDMRVLGCSGVEPPTWAKTQVISTRLGFCHEAFVNKIRTDNKSMMFPI